MTTVQWKGHEDVSQSDGSAGGEEGMNVAVRMRWT